jgi:putative peptidoglycan lipid II flippase
VTESGHERTQRGARLVAAGILASRIVGLVRGWLFARYFASGMQADAYNAASRIPNVLRNLLGEGAISASFVPVYAAALERGDERGAKALANALLGVLLLGVSVLTVTGVVLAPVLTSVFDGKMSPATAALTTKLLRIMFPMTGLMVLSGWCLGVQNAHRRFFMSYASAVMWSLAQIALLAFGGNPKTADLDRLVWLLSWATIVGSILQISAQMPQVLRLMGGSLRPALNFAAVGLRDVLKNFAPVVTALGLFQISSLIDLWIALQLKEGSTANLFYATQLYLLPLSLFGVSTAAAALPQLSRDRASGNTAALAEGVSRGWEQALFYTIPSSIAFITIGDFIVALLYESGRFGPDERAIVHFVLIGFAIGLVAYASSRVFTSSYQAAQDYGTLWRSAIVAIVISTVASVALSLPFRESDNAVAGIAAGAALGAFVNFTLLFRGLRKHVGAVDVSGPRRVATRAALATLAAVAVTFAVRLATPDAPMRLRAVGEIGLYCAVYLWAARAQGLDEASRLLNGLRRRIRS